MTQTQQPKPLRFTKKPVVIEAFQMTEERRASNADWPEWMHQAWQLDREAPGSLYPTEEGTGDGTLSIGTLEGPHLVSWGDWIIRGVKGELYPCKPDIFEATYTPETKLEAQLAAAQKGVQAAVQDGWMLVPVEPTEKMISEGSCAQTLKHGHQYIGECAAKTAWSFMLAVAPKLTAAPMQMPKPVGWFHRHPKECKNGELCNYRIASGDRKDGWEESPVYTEQQVRALLNIKEV